MQLLLCEPEDRLGSQTSTSVTRPNSMIVQARRSAFITPSGATRSVDGAELIKVSRACGFPSEPSFSEHIFYRYTHSFVELIGRIFIDILRRFVPISATMRTLDTLTTIYQLRCVGLSPPSDGDSIIGSHSPQPMALPQMLLEIHYYVTRSMDKKYWTFARHSRSQGSLIKVPERSAMSAQTKHLTRSQIPTVKRSLNGAVQCCARTRKSVKGARSQCDL